jgi:hypothetical protein
MKRILTQAILCAGMMSLFLSATGAQAGPVTLTCPTKLTINGTQYLPIAGINNQNFGKAIMSLGIMTCSYPFAFSQTSAPVGSPPSCPPLTLNLAVSGGSAGWSFGNPGTPSTINNVQGTLDSVRSPDGAVRKVCKYGTSTLTPNYTAVVWNGGPANYTCALNTSNTHSFTCTPPPCPSPVLGSAVPSTNWSATSTKPGYYAPDSAILVAGTGNVLIGGASYGDVKSEMGGSFAGAHFALVGGAGTASNLPAGVITCSYDGPPFSYNGQSRMATITIACAGGACSLP